MPLCHQVAHATTILSGIISLWETREIAHVDSKESGILSHITHRELLKNWIKMSQLGHFFYWYDFKMFKIYLIMFHSQAAGSHERALQATHVGWACEYVGHIMPTCYAGPLHLAQLHLGAQTIQEYRYRLRMITQMALRLFYVYYAQNNSCVCEIMRANEILTLRCLYLRLWSVGSGERPKMQGTSVATCMQSLSCKLENPYVDQTLN